MIFSELIKKYTERRMNKNFKKVGYSCTFTACTWHGEKGGDGRAFILKEGEDSVGEGVPFLLMKEKPDR